MRKINNHCATTSHHRPREMREADGLAIKG